MIAAAQQSTALLLYVLCLWYSLVAQVSREGTGQAYRHVCQDAWLAHGARLRLPRTRLRSR